MNITEQKKKKQADKTFQINGFSGLMVAMIVLSGGYWRMQADSDIKDPQLMEEIKNYLHLYGNVDLNKQFNKVISQEDSSETNELLKNYQNSITIKKMSISRPLLKWSTTEDVIVRVEYKVNVGGKISDSQLGYYRVDHYYLGGYWRVRYSTSEMSYYLNFF